MNSRCSPAHLETPEISRLALEYSADQTADGAER